MSRSHFINPYTFVPLNGNGPVCTADKKKPPTHAWFQKERFTGKIRCRLKFITPAVIPGKTEKKTKPVRLRAYEYNGKLAIPGSRIRGHLCNLMRAINSSPLFEPQEEEYLFRRADSSKVKKGFLKKQDNGDFKLQEVQDEVLVVHPNRATSSNLFRNATPLETPRCCQSQGQTLTIKYPLSSFHEFEFKDIKYIPNNARDVQGSDLHIKMDAINDQKVIDALNDAVQKGIAQKVLLPSLKEVQIPAYHSGTPVAGQVFFKNPDSGPGKNYRKYMVAHDTNGAHSIGDNDSKWVAFENWSGMDGESAIAGTDDESIHGHWNAWHVVDLKGLPAPKTVPDDVIAGFRKTVEHLSTHVEPDFKNAVSKMADLNDGTFVYFTIDTKGNIETIGRHYRYMIYIGTPRKKIIETNETTNSKHVTCPVQHLSGWADDEQMQKAFNLDAMKSRLWVEMAHQAKGSISQLRNDKKRNDKKLVEKDLRILASQPPKQARFYLDGGDYDSPASKIRGRKFYWHDPKWSEPMWDNEDTKKGKHAFENPLPDEPKLKEQWSRADVIMATEEEPVEFCFTIRVLNLTRDELFLLLTALAGFDAKIENGELLPAGGKESWCHKIGHARPFMGSAIISVTGLELFDFDEETWLPQCRNVLSGNSIWETNKTWIDDLKGWQAKFPPSLPQVKALKRIMNFKGAFQGAFQHAPDARISYPLGQEGVKKLSWEGPLTKHPKPFIWFAKTGSELPKAEEDVSQALEVYPRPPRQNGQGRGGYNQSRDGGRRHGKR